MKVVVDTNVLVSGLLTPFGNSAQIVRMIASGELSLCLDSRILTEYNQVLRRPKFKFDGNMIVAFMDQVEHGSIIVAAHPLPQSLPDPDDNAFLEVAIAGQAVCLVTGNLVHFPENKCQGIPVFSPAEFVVFYRKLLENL